MCGICGIFKFGGKPLLDSECCELRRMNSLLIRRGPDGEGFFFGQKAALAMRRLAVMDIQGGKQPFFSEDGNIAAVMNGEIYDFRQTRKELAAKGHSFHTENDAEILAHLYEEYGEDFPLYLRGMFAAAIYDIKRHKLLIARDRIGKKPLYYHVGGGRLIFSSELNSLMSADGIRKDINLQALDMFLSLQCVPSPLSIYKSVNKLPPASLLVAEENAGSGHDAKIRIKRYWDLPALKPNGISEEEAERTLYSLAEESVKLRMSADVPLGVFLSGGLDSSVIAALMAKNSARPIKTFTIGFKEEKFSEIPFARLTAEKYGTDHTEFVVEDSMADGISEIAAAYGEPFADMSMLPSYFISRETRKKATVALNGDGGDEIFGGYDRYRALLIGQRCFSHIPQWAKNSALKAISGLPKEAPFGIFWKAEKFLKMSLFNEISGKYLFLRSFFKEENFHDLCTEAYRSALGGEICHAARYMRGLFAEKNMSALNRMIYADFHSWLPDCLMAKMDIASMSNSLEARSPLLDHKLAEFAWSLPDDMKLRGLRPGGSKWLMRKTFSRLLPPELLKRPKTGFGIPLGKWLRGRLKQAWKETCLGNKALSRGLFRKEPLERLFAEHCSGKKDNGYQLWALLMLETWFNNFDPDFRL